MEEGLISAHGFGRLAMACSAVSDQWCGSLSWWREHVAELTHPTADRKRQIEVIGM